MELAVGTSWRRRIHILLGYVDNDLDYPDTNWKYIRQPDAYWQVLGIRAHSASEEKTSAEFKQLEIELGKYMDTATSLVILARDLADIRLRLQGREVAV